MEIQNKYDKLVKFFELTSVIKNDYISMMNPDKMFHAEQELGLFLGTPIFFDEHHDSWIIGNWRFPDGKASAHKFLHLMDITLEDIPVLIKKAIINAEKYMRSKRDFSYTLGDFHDPNKSAKIIRFLMWLEKDPYKYSLLFPYIENRKCFIVVNAGKSLSIKDFVNSLEFVEAF